MKRLRLTLASTVPYMVIISCVLVIFGKGLRMKPGEMIFGWDILDYGYYAMTFFRQSILGGSFPFWNPYIMGGYPFAASIGANVFYPFSYLFVLFPVPQAYVWYLAIHVALAAFSMYVFGRIWFDRASSLLGGIIYAFSGFFVPRVLAGNTEIIVGAAYLPLVLAYSFRAFREKSASRIMHYAGIAVTAGTLQVLGGDQRMVIFTYLALALGVITYWSLGRRLQIPVTGLAVVAGVIGASAVDLLPKIQMLTNSMRGGNIPYSWAASGTLTTGTLQQLLAPITWSYRPTQEGYMPFIESPFYIGILPLFLAISGLVLSGLYMISSARRARNRQLLPLLAFLISVAIFGLWSAFGHAASIDLFKILWVYVPFFRFIRAPIRLMILPMFAASGLAVFAFSRLRNKPIRMMLIFLTLTELVLFARPYITLTGVPELRHDPDLLSYIKNDTDKLTRFHTNYAYTERLGFAWDFNSGSIYRIFTSNGYLPSITAGYFEFLRSSMPEIDFGQSASINQLPALGDLTDQAVNYLNITHIQGKGDLELSGPQFTRLIDNQYHWYRLYENHDAYPRFFAVSGAQYFTDSDNLSKTLNDGTVSLRETVLLQSTGPAEKQSSCPEYESASVSVREYSVNRIVLTVTMPCDTYLASSEVAYPGWRAYVDGEETPVVTANLAFRAVTVPFGSHTVTFQYDPVIFRYGGLVSVITAVLCIIAVFRKR